VYSLYYYFRAGWVQHHYSRSGDSVKGLSQNFRLALLISQRLTRSVIPCNYMGVEISNPMRPQYATPEDFQRWRDHAKTLDCYTLKCIIEDCQSAERNMRGFDPVREGYYIDQACTYGMELTRRNRKPAGLRHRI